MERKPKAYGLVIGRSENLEELELEFEAVLQKNDFSPHNE
jgi:hypothetical protein